MLEYEDGGLLGLRIISKCNTGLRNCTIHTREVP